MSAPSPGQRCPHAHDDAAYVLGALSPSERLVFERHLPACTACSRAVRSFAGLPGLLDLVDPDVLADPPADLPVPATLLPSLTRAVAARRRHRTLAVAGVAASLAAAVAVAVVLAVPSVIDDVAGRGTPGAGAPRDVVDTLTMAPQGDVPVAATIGLEPVTWGTRLIVTCTYDPGAAGARLPERVAYLIYVTDTRGRTEQVGSWTSVSGTTMTVPAATSLPRDDISDVEVRTPDGRVVLRVAP